MEESSTIFFILLGVALSVFIIQAAYSSYKEARSDKKEKIGQNQEQDKQTKPRNEIEVTLEKLEEKLIEKFKNITYEMIIASQEKDKDTIKKVMQDEFDKIKPTSYPVKFPEEIQNTIFGWNLSHNPTVASVKSPSETYDPFQILKQAPARANQPVADFVPYHNLEMPLVNFYDAYKKSLVKTCIQAYKESSSKVGKDHPQTDALREYINYLTYYYQER